MINSLGLIPQATQSHPRVFIGEWTSQIPMLDGFPNQVWRMELRETKLKTSGQRQSLLGRTYKNHLQNILN